MVYIKNRQGQFLHYIADIDFGYFVEPHNINMFYACSELQATALIEKLERRAPFMIHDMSTIKVSTTLKKFNKSITLLRKFEDQYGRDSDLVMERHRRHVKANIS